MCCYDSHSGDDRELRVLMTELSCFFFLVFSLYGVLSEIACKGPPMRHSSPRLSQGSSPAGPF